MLQYRMILIGIALVSFWQLTACVVMPSNERFEDRMDSIVRANILGPNPYRIEVVGHNPVREKYFYGSSLSDCKTYILIETVDPKTNAYKSLNWGYADNKGKELCKTPFKTQFLILGPP